MIVELIATASFKPSPTPSQINTKPHTKVIFISVAIINYIISGEQKKKILQGMSKARKNAV